jgi:hypothetical protein
MVLSHVMMSPAGTTIACCLVSCLPLRVAGHSSSEVLSLQSSPWLKNLEIVVNFLFVKEQSSVTFFGRREKINTYSKVVHENQNSKTSYCQACMLCTNYRTSAVYLPFCRFTEFSGNKLSPYDVGRSRTYTCYSLVTSVEAE